MMTALMFRCDAVLIFSIECLSACPCYCVLSTSLIKYPGIVFRSCYIASLLKDSFFKFWTLKSLLFSQIGEEEPRKCLQKQGQLLFAINIVDLGSWPIKTVSLLKIPLSRLSRLTTCGCCAQMPWGYVTSFVSSWICDSLRILWSNWKPHTYWTTL